MLGFSLEFNYPSPTWSPDGEQIAYVREEVDPDGRAEEMPDWSPEGERIAYERLIPGRGLVAYQVWVMGADGMNQRNVSETEANFDLNLVWATDAKQLAFWRENRDGDEAIWAVAVGENGSPKEIIDGLTDTAFDRGARSENG